MSQDASEGEAASALDVDHLAELANLPLDEEGRDELEQACREVLEAFQIEEAEEAVEEPEPGRTFADEPEAWPEDGIEAILEAFPEREGRLLRP